MWTSKTWTFEILMSETWTFKAWIFETSSSRDWTFETLLIIPKTWGVTSKTWGSINETYFEVSESTISTFALTSLGRCSILDVYVMWVSWFFTCFLFELSNSFFSRTWMPQVMAVKSDDASKCNIVEAPSIVS